MTEVVAVLLNAFGKHDCLTQSRRKLRRRPEEPHQSPGISLTLSQSWLVWRVASTHRVQR